MDPWKTDSCEGDNLDPCETCTKKPSHGKQCKARCIGSGDRCKRTITKLIHPLTGLCMQHLVLLESEVRSNPDSYWSVIHRKPDKKALGRYIREFLIPRTRIQGAVSHLSKLIGLAMIEKENLAMIEKEKSQKKKEGAKEEIEGMKKYKTESEVVEKLLLVLRNNCRSLSKEKALVAVNLAYSKC